MDEETQEEVIEHYRFHFHRAVSLWNEQQKTPDPKTFKAYHKELGLFCTYAVELSSKWGMTQEEIQKI